MLDLLGQVNLEFKMTISLSFHVHREAEKAGLGVKKEWRFYKRQRWKEWKWKQERKRGREIARTVIFMTNLDSIFKSRDITLPTKARLVKAMVFPVVMYGCESWTVRKAELQRINAFELWCWRRLLRVPWTARRSNQSILKEIGPGCSLEGVMLKLKLQYFGHLMRRVD